jgi:hypothetical protein
VVIKPDSIPQFSGDLAAVETHAATLKTAGSDFRLTGQDIHTTWQGLSAFYEAPEAATLFAATVPVRTAADEVADDIQEVGAALTRYVQVMRPIAGKLTQLQSEARTFVGGIEGDDDWREDEGKVNRNNDLVRQVDTQTAAMMAAERQAANRINQLYGGTQWVVGDGSDNPNAYGFDASKLPADAERPWGTGEERDLPWYQDYWNMIVSDNLGFWVDGLWGDVTGLFGLINPFDWDTFSASWGGLWTLTGGLIFDTKNSLNAWKEFGKSFVAWDKWSEDPARAFGNVLYNVITLPLAPAKVGAIGKAGKAAGAAADVGKAADAGKAGKAASAAADVGKVGDVGKVEGLPTVGDLAKQIDLHLDDVLKANPDLQRALQDADALAKIDAPARIDAPEIPARVEEPVTVGGGRSSGGTDLAPPPRIGGGDGLPTTPGRGGDGFPTTPGRGGDELPADPGRTADDPINPGRTGDDPVNPGRTGDDPTNPGRKADDPVNPGRQVDDPADPGRTPDDRPGQDAPGKPGDDAPGKPGDDAPGKPGNPADDKPGGPGKPGDDVPGEQGRPIGDKPLPPVRADLAGDAARAADDIADAARGADEAADAGRGSDNAAGDAGRGADETGDSGRGADEAGDAGRPPDEAGDTGRAADEAGRKETYEERGIPEDAPVKRLPNNRELWMDNEGKWHFADDPVGTQRNSIGQFIDERGSFIDDPNKLSDKIDYQSEAGVREEPLKVPAEGGDALDAAVRDALDDRAEVVKERKDIWDDPEFARIRQELKDAGIDVDKKSLGSEKARELIARARAEGGLSGPDLLRFENSVNDWVASIDKLNKASERLGQVGGDLLEARRFEGYRRVSGGDSEVGTSGNFDRVLFNEKTGELVIIEEKGAGSGKGTRQVPDPKDPDAPYRVAEQMSPEYLRDLLQKDNKLAEVLGDPKNKDLRDQIQKAIEEGKVRYLLARTSTSGNVNVTNYKLDPERWNTDGLRVAGS